ncbi:hypothetical protein [Collimonas fungivorans]|uniref:hypothetical protein n=1 Tax=Collimonas fungivorans TaxID=158899 RepID=UPI0011D26922|nr:hypothetical protein [Collimonas fungivorans]
MAAAFFIAIQASYLQHQKFALQNRDGYEFFGSASNKLVSSQNRTIERHFLKTTSSGAPQKRSAIPSCPATNTIPWENSLDKSRRGLSVLSAAPSQQMTCPTYRILSEPKI